MTIQQLYAILRARWLVAFGALSLVMLVTVAVTFTLPKSYTATASVLVDVKNADPIVGSVSPSLATPAFLMTQVDILNSKRVAMRTVRNLKLVQSPAMLENWKSSTHATGNFEGWLATLIQHGMEARPSRGSNVIKVSYKAADPQFAAVVANGFVQAYLETVLELRINPAKRSKEYFDASAHVYRQALEEAQEKLSAYQRQQDLLVTDERLDVEMARLNELSNQYVLLQAAAADSGSREAAADAQGDRSPDVMANPLVATLQSDLVRQQTSLEQLATRLGEAHPAVVEARTGIAETRHKLDQAIQRVTHSVGVGNAVNVSRLGKIKAALEQQRERVLKLKATRDEAAILQRDVDSAQRAYDGVLARMNASALESQAHQANITTLETAVAPSLPSSPRIFTNLALGAVLASVSALAAALLFERLDRRLRVPVDVERVLNQALIGSIPSFGKRKQRKRLPFGDAGLRGLSAPLKALPNHAS